MLLAGVQAQHILPQDGAAVEEVGQRDIDGFICKVNDTKHRYVADHGSLEGCGFILCWQEPMSSAPASEQFLVTLRSLQKQWFSGLSVGAARVLGCRVNRYTSIPFRSMLC